MVRLWRTDTGAPIRSLSGHAGVVSGVRFARTGGTLATCSWDGTAILWNANQGAMIGLPLVHPGPVRCIALSSDGQSLASGAQLSAPTVTLWQTRPGAEALRMIGYHTNSLVGTAVSSNGQTVVSGDSGGSVRIWRGADGTLLRTVTHPGLLRALALSPDGTRLATAGGDRLIRLWNVFDGSSAGTLDRHTAEATVLAFTSDGGILASGSADNTIQLWSMPDGIALRTLTGVTAPIALLGFARNSSLLAAVTQTGVCGAWRVSDGALLNTIYPDNALTLSLSVAPDGDSYYIGGADRSIRQIRAAGGTQIRTLAGHLGAVTALTISADGQTLISGSDPSDNLLSPPSLRVWRLTDGTLRKEYTQETGTGIVGLDSPLNGSTIAVARKDGTVMLIRTP